MQQMKIIIRGGGDIGTGVAHRLHRCGLWAVVLEVPRPTVIRRKVAFAQAVYDGTATVEGVTAVLAHGSAEIDAIRRQGRVPVAVDPGLALVRELQPAAVVDAILAKKNIGMHRGLAPLTVALGPGFEAGRDVDVVIETSRGHDLGKLIYAGCARANTGTPEPVRGFAEQRVLRAPCDGTVKSVLAIGDAVRVGTVVCQVGDVPVAAAIDGVVRGCITDGLPVTRGCKIGDIDPRGVREHCFTISDKARAVGGSVLEAILSSPAAKGR